MLAEAGRQPYLDYDREQLQRRAARLAGNWGCLHVGGGPADGVQRMRAAQTAVATLRAAASGGVVASGGAALMRVGRRLAADATDATDAERGALLCAAAGLYAVIRQLRANAGQERGLDLGRLTQPGAREFAFDARIGALSDIASCGIADPLTVTVGLVRRGLSAAAVLLRVEAIVSR